MLKKLTRFRLKTAARFVLSIALLLFAGPFLQAGESPPLAADSWGTDLEGKPFEGSSLRGKIVLLDFWAAWVSSPIRLPHGLCSQPLAVLLPARLAPLFTSASGLSAFAT